MSKDKKDAAYSIDASRIVGTTLLGAGLATATFFLSDFALPSDTEWWVHWAMSGASLASYTLGVAATVAELRKTAEDTIRGALERSDREHAEEVAELKRAVAKKQQTIESETREKDRLQRALDARESELDGVRSVALSKSDIDALHEEIAALSQMLSGMEHPKNAADQEDDRPMTSEKVHSVIDECERQDQVAKELSLDECRALVLLYDAEVKGEPLSDSGLEDAFHSLWLKQVVVKNRSDRAAVGIEPSWLIAEVWKSQVKLKLKDLRRRADVPRDAD